VAHAPEQRGQRGVGRGLLAQKERRPVPARLDLAAFAGAPLRLGERLAEALRARRAELDREEALHLYHGNRPGLAPIAGLDGRLRAPCLAT
jgi:hypothetical protein